MMLRKAVSGVVAGLALGAVSAASAVEIGGVTLDMSAGNGLFFASDFGGGVVGIKGTTSANVISQIRGKPVTFTNPWAGGGIHLFFDAMYAEIGLNFTGGGGKLNVVIPGVPDSVINSNFDVTLAFANIGISVLGKYPFAVTDRITLFPAAGIEYAIALAVMEYEGVNEDSYGYNGALDLWDGANGEPKAGDFSALWFKFGGGADFFLNESVFIRPEILYGIRLANKYEKEGTYYGLISRDGKSPVLGHGLTFKVGMGCKF